MKILLVHSEDDPRCGDWTNHSWDRVIDLGRASPNSYQRWSRFFGCETSPLEMLEPEDFRTMRGILARGFGALMDGEGLDWWELNSMFFHQQLETVIALRRLVDRLGPQNELFVTRPGMHAEALRWLTVGPVKCFSNPLRESMRRSRHYLRIWSKFPLPQIVEILGDKYDPSYSVRRLFAQRGRRRRRPAVLLPSAYGNVSRTAVAYANTAPETQFLLVTTRRSGRVENLPPNVMAAELASYASRKPESETEYKALATRWQRLRAQLRSIPEIALLGHLGVLDAFPQLLHDGLKIRDAWLRVFEEEFVTAVLCADDTNPYTHIPLLLARIRSIPALVCHHGALDGRHLFKRSHADLILAKGRMEEDFLLRVCGVAPDLVEVGAPVKPIPNDRSRIDSRSPIVFFSEPYDIFGGRAREFYLDILPPLADLAAKAGRRLVIKLHPAESLREREQLARRILTAERQRPLQILSGPLTGELLSKAYFAVTVLSTAAMECARAGVPCFLCEWLDYGPYRYIEQFRRFGVGQVLRSAAEINEIPVLLKRDQNHGTIADLWRPIESERFQELLSGDRKTAEDAVAI